MKISQFMVSGVLLAASSYLVAQDTDQQPSRQQVPDSGQLLQEIHQQQLTQSLSDGIRTQQRVTPDQPWLVVDGGMALPEALCTADPQACHAQRGGH